MNKFKEKLKDFDVFEFIIIVTGIILIIGLFTQNKQEEQIQIQESKDDQIYKVEIDGKGYFIIDEERVNKEAIEEGDVVEVNCEQIEEQLDSDQKRSPSPYILILILLAIFTLLMGILI